MKQASKESLIYLLYLALYADGVLSETEDQSFSNEIENLGWDHESDLQTFSIKAFGEVRELISRPTEVEAFVNHHANVIHTADDAIASYTILSRVLRSDDLEIHEKSYLKRLEKLWFPS